jgi:hypothetical protein
MVFIRQRVIALRKRVLMDSQSRVQKTHFRVERNFGLLVGGVFAGLGLWWLYRGKFGAVAPGFLALGSALVVLGAIYPKALVPVNRAWMALAEMLGFIMTRVILAIVFFLVVTPIGLVKRLRGWDPLRLRAASSESYWKPYSTQQRNPRHYEKMY